MLIGELARQAGVTTDTIRFYEKKGLLRGTHVVRKDNNYKDYGPAALGRLQLISRGKRAGFTLSEIARWTQEWQELDTEERRRVFQAKIEQVEYHIAELEEMKAYLAAKLAAASGGA